MRGKPVKLKTKRLALTPTGLAELAAKRDAQTDEHLKKAYTVMIEGVESEPEHAVWRTEWRICRKEDGATVGGIGFKGAPCNKTVEVGYGIDEPYRGNGYATEALMALCNWAFAQPGVYFIRAEAEEGNPASVRVLTKCGFLPVGQGTEGILFEPKNRKPPICRCSCALARVLGRRSA